MWGREQRRKQQGHGSITMRGTRITRALFLLSLALGLVAISQSAPAHASVFKNSVRWDIRADGYAIIPVCIVAGSSAAQKDGTLTHDPNPALSIVVGQVRDALRTSWEKHSSVRFVGWEDCTSLTPSEQAGAVGLYIHPDAGNRTVGLGTETKNRTSDGAGAGVSFKPWGHTCIDYDAARARMEYDFACAEQYGIHELGHAIGFDHEWFNPVTPSACFETPFSASDVSTKFEVKKYTVVNMFEFDWDSIMTYEPECADVTGVRFGSPNLSSWDQKGAAEVYPPVPQRPNDVGVIPAVAGSCPDPTEVKIYQDNDDDDNRNDRGGWIGPIVSDRNTTFEFCRVDGTRFGRLAPTQAGNDYAVLLLGDSCPAGSTEFVRYHDDADTPPVNESWMAGETGPTRQNFDGGDGTELHWCLFRQSLGLPGMFRFPDFGFNYGVLAAPTLSEAAETGFVYTDDEDTANQNRLMNAALSPLDDGTKAVVDTLMETGPDTKFLLARVNTNEPPTVSAVLENASPDEGESVSFSAIGDDPNGDALSYSWDFGDGGTASGATASHIFRDNGTYTVTATVMDSSGLTASTTLTVSVGNAVPTASVTDAAVDENGVATVSVTIDDPGVEDTFRVEIFWGDGFSEVNRPASASGTQTFEATHRYVDDDPSGTSTDEYEVRVNVGDDERVVGDERTTSWATGAVTVANVAPSVSVTGAAIDENEVATVAVTIDDPGVEDTFDVAVRWGDGATDTYTRPASAGGNQTFDLTHRYLDDDPSGTPADDYSVTVTVTDDDTGTADGTATVSVANVAPEASIDAVAQGGNLVGNVPPADVDVVLAGLAVDLEASFTDVGPLDSHELAVAWGDGTVDRGAASGQVAGSHVYAAPGEYMLTVTVTDDDSGTVTVSQPLRVVDAAGAVADAVDGLNDLAGDPSTDPVAAGLIAKALVQLVGNDGGTATNGALDKLEVGAWNDALVKLAKAVTELEQANDLADVDLSVAVTQLVFSAKAVVVDQYGRASANATPDELSMLAAAEALIRDGDARWALGDGAGAIDTYRKALNALPR